MPATEDLIIPIGFQSAYTSAGLPLFNRKVVDSTSRLKERLKTIRGTDSVLAVREVRSVEDSFWKHDATRFYVGSKDIAVPEFLTAYSRFMITATRPNAAEGTALITTIRQRDPRRIILFGQRTHLNILHTAYAIASNFLNIELVVIESLCCSDIDYLHNMAISLMADTLGITISSDW